MKLVKLIGIIEEQRAMVSQAKSKAEAILAHEGLKFSKEMSKPLNTAIDSFGKMISAMYSEIDYDVDFVSASKGTMFHKSSKALKEGFIPDTEMSLAIGSLNSVKAQTEKLYKAKDMDREYSRIINGQTNETIAFTKKYIAAQKAAVKAVSSASKILDTVFTVEEED